VISHGPRSAPLAREVRLLLAYALGSWAMVLQLVLLMVVGAGLVVVLMMAARNGGSWLGSAVGTLVNKATGR
jgi:hypothetical protein